VYEGEEERQSGANKQLMSWWWSRAYPDPAGINQKFYHGWLHARALRDSSYLQREQKQAAPALFGGNWTSIGPSQNIGGRILCIAIDPQNNNRLFAGSASGGIWRSVTAGAGTNAWQPVHTGFPLLGVSSIIINPSNSNIIYAGTGEVYRADTSNIGFNVWKARGTYGIGILKSVNGGTTWTQVFNRTMPSLFGVQMLKFDPANSNIVYACTTDGLYRSTDAGANWNKILDKIYVSDLAIHPANSNLMVAAVGNLQNADKGIYRSVNGGANWTKIASGLPAAFDGFTRLDNVSASPDMIIASIGRSAGTSQNELYRSNDFGQTWTVLSNSNHCQYQFWFAHDVAINPANTSQLIMGGVPLYNFTMPSTRSSIGGVHADIHDIEFDPVNNNNVYVTCDGGIYKSTNSGSSFSMINGGLHAVQFYASLAVSPANPNIIIGGLQDNGVVRYNGAGWTSVAGGDGGPCAFHPTNGNIAFASNDARRVLRSTNSGTGFSEVLSSWAFAADSRTGFMAPVAISPSNPSIMYVASDNLHKSTNGGVSWTGNNYNSATSYIEARHKTGVALAVSPVNANKLYVSTSPFAQQDNDGIGLHINAPPNVMKSTNGGSSFTSIKANLPDRFVMDFGISPTNDDSVWVVLGGFGTSHVYMSGNGGLSWTSRGAGLPDVPHNAILLDPRDASVIYVGNDLGVYMSPDRGLTWHDYNEGLWDATLVVDLVATTNRLVAATHGKGVFVSDLFMVRLAFGSVSFTGQHKGSYNQLQWTTSAEEGTHAFELERNTGQGWQHIATVPAANIAGGSNYQYPDDVHAIQENTAMYRLKMIDRSGGHTYSDVVTLRMPRLNELVFTGRNPFINELKLSLELTRPHTVTLRLFDAAGKLVATGNQHAQRGPNPLRLGNLAHLPKGSYVLEVALPDEKRVFKLMH
jgi:hypothetical protein